MTDKSLAQIAFEAAEIAKGKPDIHGDEFGAGYDTGREKAAEDIRALKS